MVAVAVVFVEVVDSTLVGCAVPGFVVTGCPVFGSGSGVAMADIDPGAVVGDFAGTVVPVLPLGSWSCLLACLSFVHSAFVSSPSLCFEHP